MSRIIGLTGGIATGKSTVSRFLSALGAEIIDADQLARDVVEPGTDGAREIALRFGSEYFDEAEHLDRKKLGALVFSDRQARADLAQITHPKIAALAQQQAAQLRAKNPPLIVYDAALLVENGIHRALGGLLVVETSQETQLDRLMQRDHLNLMEAQKRIDSQMPLAEKVALADWVIDNNGSLEETRRQVRELWPTLTADAR